MTTNYGYGTGNDLLATLSVDGMQRQAIGYTADGRIATLNPDNQAPGGQYITSLSYNQDARLSAVNAAGGGAAVYTSAGLAYYRHADWLGSSRLASGSWTDLVYGARGLLAEATSSTVTYRMINRLGSAVGALSSTGGSLGTQDYAPFGELFNGSGIADPYKFTGKERDTETGNDNFGARYYASVMGRFISPDWSAKVEPVPYAKLDNPQSLNLYTYVFNNPVTGVDLDGHQGPDSPGDPGPLATYCGPAKDDGNYSACLQTWTSLEEKWSEWQRTLQQNKHNQAQQQSGNSQQLHDITSKQGGEILGAAKGYQGTPYKFGGNSKQGIDCSHLVCDSLSKVGIAAREQTADNFTKAVPLRALGPDEKRMSGDIVIWQHNPTGHVGIYDADPSKPGYNIMSATNHGVMEQPASSFNVLGTPTYYRVQAP